jgi:hypothetical protein
MSLSKLLPPVDVRKLAAVDMFGARGSWLRRRVILVEFVLGTAGGIAFGVWALTSWSGAVGLVFGVWLLGLAANYCALALHAATLSGAGVLDAELRDTDLPIALRHYTAAQFWIFVPMLFALLAVIQFADANLGR